ncbi:hypothetical protein [Roseofilum sp. Belize Diploria]|nr:hypothetical protein [Roseofilum sp. Belize Diploria]MBP0007136.1 hypothetical protein [Roseofilum sp. Belize Diploria]
MRTPLSLDKYTALLLAGALAIASWAQPSWANSSIERVDTPYQDAIQLLKGYEPPDNGSPDSTGDTGGR